MSYITRKDNISILPLSVRSMNCLHNAGINTIGAMIDYPIDEFINIRNVGKKSVAEIQNFIQAIKAGTCGEYILVDEKESSSLIAENNDVSPVFQDENGLIVSDLSITKLNLSNRALNCLTGNGIESVSQLIGKTYMELMKIKNMGKKTAKEILSCIEKITVKQGTCATKNYVDDDFSNELATEMYKAYGESESVWLREILPVKVQFPEVMGETLIYRLYDSVFVRGTMKSIILKIIEENNNKISIASLKECLPSHLNNTTILREILLELKSNSAIEIGEVMIYRQYPSVVEFAANIENERIREVIQGRIEGKTLQEIGDMYGVTRERVRQLMQKGLKKKPYLREDKYVYLYEHYKFSLNDFMLIFDEPQETFHYLDMICSVGQSEKKTLDEDFLADEKIPSQYRENAERVIYSKYITIDGVLVEMKCRTLVKLYIKNNCKNITKYNDFFEKYHIWLESLGIEDNKSLQIDSSSYRNYIRDCDFVLWSQWQSFRYYNIPEHDYEELFSTIDLESFENVEISTLKLFRNYPELMQQYDIRDKYELHNLLKKLFGKNTNSKIKFPRMPTIEIGKVDLNEQIFSLFLQYAPIAIDDLAKRYEEEYGVEAATVKGSYLKVLDDYYHKGIYSFDYPSLNSEQLSRLKEILTQDFYTIQEIKRLYKREFGNLDESLINSYNLKTLNFRVYSGYVIKNTYSTAAEYFYSLFTKDDIFDEMELDSSIQKMPAYFSELNKLCANYEMIEFSPKKWINIRRLKTLGITVDSFEKYCNAVFNNYEKGEYFTITSLQLGGFKHEIDDLGFDNWFYASILINDKEHFSYQRIGKTRVLLCGKKGANLGNMLVWLLEKKQKIDIYDLKDLLEKQYGIFLSKERIIEVIKSTGVLYYDIIMETVYIDYETYFEEI